MKIVKLSENQIKIELSEKEITSWSTVANTRIPDYNAMMVDLISAAERETGISFRNCRVVVEASGGANGVYTILVSREGAKPTAHRIRDKRYTPKNNPPLHIVAEFEDLEYLCMFNRHYPLYATLLKGANTLYSFNNLYYLDIHVPPRFSGYAEALQGNLLEFSVSANGTAIPHILVEHGNCLIPGDALNILKQMN